MQKFKEAKGTEVHSSFASYAQENLLIDEEDLDLSKGFHDEDVSVVKTLLTAMKTFVNSGNHDTLPPGD